MRNPFKKKKCVKCEIQERELDYLKTLVDRLLVDRGVAPVKEEEFDIDKALEIEPARDEDGKVKEGVETYGS